MFESRGFTDQFLNVPIPVKSTEGWVTQQKSTRSISCCFRSRLISYINARGEIDFSLSNISSSVDSEFVHLVCYSTREYFQEETEVGSYQQGIWIVIRMIPE